MDPLTFIIVLLAVVALVAALSGRVDPFTAIIVVIGLIAVAYAVPRLR